MRWLLCGCVGGGGVRGFLGIVQQLANAKSILCKIFKYGKKKEKKRKSDIDDQGTDSDSWSRFKMCTLDLGLYFWTFTLLMLVTFSSARAQTIQTNLAITHKLAPLSLALSFNLWQVRITHTSWLMGLSTNLFFHLACTAEQSTQRESSSLWSAHSPRHVVHLCNRIFFFYYVFIQHKIFLWVNNPKIFDYVCKQWKWLKTCKVTWTNLDILIEY